MKLPKNEIPDFQTLMLPMLQVLSDGNEHTLQELVSVLSDKYELTDEQKSELLPSGTQPIINNRVAWTRTYLTKAGLVYAVERAKFKITDAGLKVLAGKPQKIDRHFLNTLPDFINWQTSYKNKPKNDHDESNEEIESDKTPLELLEYSYSKMKDELAFEVLEKVRKCTPTFFERLVVDLLVKMGYGGYRKDAGQIVGKSGDGGIDGIIKEDKLGLDTIYIQAKKWENQVTISSIRDFAGSLLSKKAKKGIFLTTSTFPSSAYDFVESIEHKIVLIDGKELAKLMIEHNVGVGIKETYEVKRIDIDYFEGL